MQVRYMHSEIPDQELTISIYKYLKCICTIWAIMHRKLVTAMLAAQMEESGFQKINMQENKAYVSVWSMLLVCNRGGASSFFR